MAIPENESQDKYVRIVRQSSGIESCRLQPIIRHHPDGDYRVSRIEEPGINFHRVYRTDEFMKQLKMYNKKVSQQKNINIQKQTSKGNLDSRDLT